MTFKLCLNNIIQDNTYMKDYLCYTMMDDFGVASPLCSFVYVTFNGEDWGLYLAVEGVEDSFLQRNYGNDDVNLYKPDSMSMGGGRGNGKGFDMDRFNEEQEKNKTTAPEQTETDAAEGTELRTQTDGKQQNNNQNRSESPGGFDGNMPDFGGAEMPDAPPGGFGGNMPDFGGAEMPDAPPGGFGGNMPDFSGGEMPDVPPGGFGENMPDFGDTETPQAPDDRLSADGNKTDSKTDSKADNKRNKFGGMGSDDVKLIYTDDSFSSYSDIFDNAKTKISSSDKKTLISSLKSLNEGTDLENTVDTEQVIRYFVVHNFVLNGDSYTGSMIHNYYLTENNGQLSMIPWDYNLAFGGFQSMGSAESLVNSPIDSPVSGGTTDSRPMLAWIFNNEEYTQRYHELFSEFVSEYFESGKFEAEIDRVKEMISPYVEKDPTKFCTYEEFIKGIDTLKEFCLLRSESITGQLNGTIGSTTEAQTDKTNFVSADNITVSDMGSMGNMGKGGDMPMKGRQNADTPPSGENSENKK